MSIVHPKFGRIGALAGLAMGVVLSVAGPAAAGEPAAACGNGWQLRTIDGAVTAIYDVSPDALKPLRAPGSAWWTQTTAVFTDFDQAGNADGYVCTRTNGPNSGQDKVYCADVAGCSDYVITNVNDNNAVGRTGK